MGDEHGKCQGDGVVAIHKSTIAIKTWWITPKKKVYCNKKNRCNNIRVIAIVDTRCCNKIWGNNFVQQKILLQ